MIKRLHGWIAAALVVGVMFAACSDDDPTGPGGSEGPDFLHRIENVDDFVVLQNDSDPTFFTQARTIKLVYELSSDEVYFFNTTRFEGHYPFSHRVLGYPFDSRVFLETQYTTSKDRRYALASIVHYKASDIYTLQFWGGDQITADLVLEVYRQVRSRVFFGGQLKFMATSQSLRERTEHLKDLIPVIHQDVIFAGQSYVPLNFAESYGFLRKIAASELGTVNPGRHDIVLTDEVPNDLPVVSGIITSDFQSVLSHINVLSRNRGTPNMSLRDAWQNPHLNSLLNQLVRYEVRKDTFFVEPASLEDAEAFWEANEPAKGFELAGDFSVSGLMEITDLDSESSVFVGAKAANFGELAKITVDEVGPLRLPEGAFAIPFYYYIRHLEHNGIDEDIRTMLASQDFQSNIVIRERELSDLRNKIENAPIDPEFLSMVENKIISSSTFRRIRFRSSTNAEDLAFFNGAGLYDSKTGIIGDGDKSVAQAIRQVWASVWNLRAFEEREFYKIDHETVAMGILAHRSFPDEEANGVAVTRNLYHDRFHGFTVNVQEGEISVVSPPPGVTSEQFVFLTYNPDGRDVYDEPHIEYISNSNINNGKLVLNQAESVLLARNLQFIKLHFYYSVFDRDTLGEFTNFGMDVEFKLDGPERALYIKQARPYR